jgi:hypothetical protein
LADLRHDRNEADYDLESDAFRDRATVLQNILASQRIDDLLRRCCLEPELTVARAGIRRYAKQVLRLPVSE